MALYDDRYHNKLIIVPKDKEALKALDYDEAADDQLLTLSLGESQFLILWESGFFHAINNVAHSNIDIFEDDAITDIGLLENTVRSYAFQMAFPNVDVEKIVADIKGLFLQAISNNTGVFFYF